MPTPSPDPRLPIPDQPGGVLPRIAYKAPEPSADEIYGIADAPAGKAKDAGAAEAKANDEAPKPRLKEATPELDTVEARRKIRIIVGIVAACVVVLIGVIMVQLVTRADKPPVEAGFEAPAPDPGIAIARNESSARALLDEARLYDKQGRREQAVQRLERVVASYGATRTAGEARAAMERLTQRLPLFPEGDIIAAKAPEEVVAPEAKAKEETVTAAPVSAPTKAEAPATKVATIAPPPVAPEAYRETGLARERAEVAALALPEGFRARPEAGVHPSGWPNEITTDRDGSAMVLVPAGAFTIGNAQGRPAERPERSVAMPAYYIDQHEVTVAQFNGFLKAVGKPLRKVEEGEDRPVARVTWDEAQAYAKWAGKTLPSEAQWEKAARATDGRIYPWGVEKAAWEPARAPRQIDCVCSFGRDLSPYGAFDMSGNAWEWTSDWFEARAYQGERFKVADPKGPAKSAARIPEVAIRGGSAEWDVTWR